MGWNLKDICFNVNYPDRPFVVYFGRFVKSDVKSLVGTKCTWLCKWNWITLHFSVWFDLWVLIQIIKKTNQNPTLQKNRLGFYQNLRIPYIRILSTIPKTNKCAVFCWDFFNVSLQTLKLKAPQLWSLIIWRWVFVTTEDERKCPIGQKRRWIRRGHFFGYSLPPIIPYHTIIMVQWKMGLYLQYVCFFHFPGSLFRETKSLSGDDPPFLRCIPVFPNGKMQWSRRFRWWTRNHWVVSVLHPSTS